MEKLEARVPSNLTAVTRLKSLPRRVTVVPTEPVVGLKDRMDRMGWVEGMFSLTMPPPQAQAKTASGIRGMYLQVPSRHNFPSPILRAKRSPEVKRRPHRPFSSSSRMEGKTGGSHGISFREINGDLPLL